MKSIHRTSFFPSHSKSVKVIGIMTYICPIRSPKKDKTTGVHGQFFQNNAEKFNSRCLRLILS